MRGSPVQSCRNVPQPGQVWIKQRRQAIEALELDSNLAPAYTQRAAVYWEKNQWDQAEADCRQAIKLDESLAVAWSGLGLALGAKGKFDDAMKAFDRTVSWTPRTTTCFSTRREDLVVM